MEQKWKWCLVYVAMTVMVLSMVGVTCRTVTVMSENRMKERRAVILIDPGHGGEDGGAVSVTGRAESVYNLEISKRLRDLLRLLGYETRMTRDSDISIYTKGETLAQKKVSDLKERVRIINSTDNVLLLSIHQNFFPEERFSGPQVFYGESQGSEKMAKHLQELLVTELDPDSHRSAKRSSGVYLMEQITCPGVLIECGFLSNYQEEAALRDSTYQKKLSAVIAVGTCQYLSNT